MTATMSNTAMRYTSTLRHDIARCEQGLAPILDARCPCGGALFGARRGNGSAFFESLPEADAHSFKLLPNCEAQLKRPKRASIGQPFPTTSIPSSASTSKEKVKR
jgi:hypothetical protein